jgi:hypothetical protein
MDIHKRKPGAQPGNQNALKHGFYSRVLRPFDRCDGEPVGLQDEIHMLRAVMRRVLELSREVDTLEPALNLLSALGLAAYRLSVLLRAQKTIGGGEDEISEAISQALAEVVKDMGILK